MSYGKQLESAAHDKSLVRSMNQAPTGLEIMRPACWCHLHLA
jgi:hypothetical protein